ncbi:MAG: response regulator, partial [Gammaproteobacteria bacterium]|nr:response regulator [Gammaproteobacteria bacterium]
ATGFQFALSIDLEAQLRSCQAHLAGVESAARLCSYVLELDTRKLTWSPEAYALFGIPEGTPLRRSLILERIHPEDRDAVIRAVEALERGEVYDLEHRIIANGRVVWVRARTVLEYDEHGRPRRAIGVAQDITIERATEQALRERGDFEHFVSQLSTRFVTSADLDTAINISLRQIGRFTHADRAHVFRFDEPAARFSNTHEWCRDGVVSELANSQNLRSSDFAWWLKALRRGELIEIEDVAALPPEAAAERAICESQKIRALLTMPILRDGKLVAYAGLENIHTARPWSEIQCRALRVFSDLLSTALRREQLEAQLRRAQKLEAVGRLAGGVAHDFNNMLSVILGAVDMAKLEVEATHPVAKSLEGIREAGMRSAELTRQLLGFASKQTIAPQVLDLNATISGMVSMLARLIGEGVELAWAPCKGVPAVEIDPAQLDQVLVNLVINARDACAGHGSVTIETRILTADEALCASHEGMRPGERYVALSVCDDGVGMDDESRARVFEPFNSTKLPGQGSGLGLATVYGIVRQNAGFVSVTSAPDAGACFTIYLRAFQSDGVLAARPEPLSAQRPARGSETVLLVEDEALLLELSQRMLEELGYRVLAADSPAQALVLFDRHGGRIDVLVSDVIMPGMSGRELWQLLLERQPGLPCVFMSGYPQDVLAPHGVLDRGLYFLQKPFRMRRLAERVREALDA